MSIMVKILKRIIAISLLFYVISLHQAPTRLISPLPEGVTTFTVKKTQYSGRLTVEGDGTYTRIPKRIEAYSQVARESTTLPSVIRGRASWYGSSKAECLGCSPDRITASGRKYNEMEFTAACAKRFSLGQTLEVRYQQKVVRVTCTDRGGFEEGYGRVLDLSKASFAQLAPLGKGVINVEVTE